MTYSRIIGTGSYLPEYAMGNADLEKLVDTSDEWIKSRTGIKTRHIAATGETTCDLAEHAARQAITTASIKTEQIELIIVATTTPDLIFPSTACLLQQRLGIRGSIAFDVQAVCSGFIYAMSIADKFIRTSTVKNALIIGAETLSRIIDWNDRDTCVLFGDGAGAVILESVGEPGIVSTCLHADGAYQELLKVPIGVSTGLVQSVDEKTVSDNKPFIKMQGNEVFKLAVRTLGRAVKNTLSDNGLQQEDIDWLVPHQANMRIISATAKKLNMPMDKVVLTIDKHGNTSAASIPLALDVAVRDGRIQRGQMLLFEAFGGGFTWGTALVKY